MFDFRRWLIGWFLFVAAATTTFAQTWQSEGPFGGVIADVAIDPSDPNTLYAATSSAGVFRSDDGGKTWTLPGDDMTSRDVKWIEVDPGTKGTVWLGLEGSGGARLWRSRDRGASWQAVNDGYKGELARLQPTGNRLAFSASRPGDIWVPSTNLHYRTRDGGKTWTDFRVTAQDAYAIAVHPRNPDIVWAGGSGDKHSLSQTTDGGKTWKPVGSGLPNLGLQHLVVDRADPPGLYAATSSRIFKSLDGGATFVELSLPASSPQITKITRDIKTGTLWVATDDGLFKSRDGGSTWTQTDKGAGRFIVRGVAVNQADGTVYAATAGGGMYRSADAGATWNAANTGLAALFVRQLYARAGSDMMMVLAATGDGFRRDGTTWSALGVPLLNTQGAIGVDGFLFDRTTPTAAWAHTGGDVWRTTDSGRSWAPLDLRRYATRSNRPGFLSMAQDPSKPTTLWAGAWSPADAEDAVYVSTDSGKEWRRAGRGLPDERVQYLVAAASNQLLAVVDRRTFFVSRDGGTKWAPAGTGLPDEDPRAVVVDPSQPTRVYVPTEEGLYRSTDFGATFTKMGGALAKEDVEAVAVGPDGTVFVGSFTGVYRSTDGGTTWTNIKANLPNTDVRALAIGGAAALRLWVGVAGGSVWSLPLP